jgi:tetratricopeptide (TPR) repeat protein
MAPWISVPASLAHQPLIDLSPTAEANLAAEAVSDWLGRTSHWDLGASMYLHGSSRWLLHRAGMISDWRSFSSLKTSNEKWKLLERNWQLVALSTPERLYFVRLLLYLAFYSDAEREAEFCRIHTVDPAERLWAIYLRELARRLQAPLAWLPNSLECAAQEVTDGPSSLLFLVALQLLSYYCGSGSRPDLERTYSEIIDACLKDYSAWPDEATHSVAYARFQRHRAVCWLRRGENERYLNCIDDALAHATGRGYIEREAARRIHSFAANTAREQGAVDLAHQHAAQAFALDPTCGSAAMLLGELSEARGDGDDARLYFHRAALMGVLERPYALARLARLEGPTETGVIELVSSDPLRLPETASAGRRLLRGYDGDVRTLRATENWLDRIGGGDGKTIFSTPVRVEDFERTLAAAPADSADLRESVQRSEAYSRFAVFWRLDETDAAAPLPFWARQPRKAWNIFQQAAEPWFQTLYFQSTQRPEFRDRLLWSAAGTSRLLAASPVFGETLESLDGESPEISELIARWRCRASIGAPLERARIGRVLFYLGFAREAAEFTVMPAALQWNDVEAYAAYTHLFLRYLNRGDSSYLRDCEEAYHRMPETEESLRTRLNVCIQCGAFCGQAHDLSGASAWRSRGLPLLHSILHCASFSIAERLLLESRFWRFAAFVPFLRGEREVLRQEGDLYLIKAREAASRSVYGFENLYAALETRARIAEWMGDLRGALNYLQELADSIDPWDGKVWLNIGDLRQKLGQCGDAAAAFVRAARLGPPTSDIGWYRAACCYEDSGNIEEAIRSHLRSLASYPLGKSPLMEIARLAKTTGNKYLRSWASAALSRLLSGYTLSSDLKFEIAQALS